MRNAPNSILEWISYTPATGEFIRLKAASRTKAGDRADRADPRGYRRIRFQGCEYRAHRVAWWIMTGVWPDLMIDHRNLDRSDNRWGNLRLATNSQNQANTASRTILPKGVTVHKQTGKFQAQIKCGGKNHYLGLFGSSDDAHGAYLARASELFGDFVRAA